MQAMGENYYDIPNDELPSANFAARPTGDINEPALLDIDGLSNFINFTSSSSEKTANGNDIDDGPTPPALTPETSLMPQPDMPNTPPTTSDITVTLPFGRQSLPQRLGSVSGVTTTMKRRSLWQKADTTPPGAFASAGYAPQVPRRAISARLEKRNAAKRHLRHLSSETDLKAKKGMDAEETRLRNEDQILVGPSQESDGEEGTENEIPQTHASFRKSKAQEATMRGQPTRLRIDFVGSESEDLEDLPQLMLCTPLEMYAMHARQPGRFSPTRAVDDRRGPSTPTSSKAPSPSWEPQAQSSDRVAVGEDLEDLEDLHQTRMHVTGPIDLEKHSAMLRKDSVATLDPFPSEADSIGRRPSDLMALEQIVVYFDGMGLIEEATDECLDRYWLDEQQQVPQGMDSGVMELESFSPQSQQSKRSSGDASNMHSKFLLSSASSGAPMPQGHPQKRQLIRLKKLLSPALPGSKYSENCEQQTGGS